MKEPLKGHKGFALIVEDAAESFGAKYLYHGQWKETGAFGDYNCISFNGNNVSDERAYELYRRAA